MTQHPAPDHEQPSRLSTLIMASFGGACIVFAALALMRSPVEEAPESRDPLEALAPADANPEEDPGRHLLVGQEVTFPRVLSDQERPTTAMEVVRAAKRGAEPEVVDEPLASESLADALPASPLPAQDVLDQSPAGVPAGDTLRSVANRMARENPSAEPAPPGTPGGYQLQVSSFQEAEEAEQFALILRRRGHRAHVHQVNVQGRGLWFRVRIGPFRYKQLAQIYREDLEAKERLVAFIVEPPRARIRIGPAAEEP